MPISRKAAGLAGDENNSSPTPPEDFADLLGQVIAFSDPFLATAERP